MIADWRCVHVNKCEEVLVRHFVIKKNFYFIWHYSHKREAMRPAVTTAMQYVFNKSFFFEFYTCSEKENILSKTYTWCDISYECIYIVHCTYLYVFNNIYKVLEPCFRRPNVLVCNKILDFPSEHLPNFCLKSVRVPSNYKKLLHILHLLWISQHANWMEQKLNCFQPVQQIFEVKKKNVFYNIEKTICCYSQPYHTTYEFMCILSVCPRTIILYT